MHKDRKWVLADPHCPGQGPLNGLLLLFHVKVCQQDSRLSAILEHGVNMIYWKI